MHPGLTEYARKLNPIQAQWTKQISHERALSSKAYLDALKVLEDQAVSRLRATPYFQLHHKGMSEFTLNNLTVRTSKADLRERLNEYRLPRRSFTDFLQVTTSTSGSTGAPLFVNRSIRDIAIEEAFQTWWRREIGWTQHMTVAVMRGAFPDAFKRGEIFMDFKGTGRFLLNTYGVNPEAVEGYVNHLNAHKPEVIYAYPSSIANLAQTIAMSGRDVYRPKLVVVSSETLTDSMRAVVSEVFQCPVFDWYGLAERAVAAAQCLNGRYHFLSNYAHTNIIDGEIYGTPLRWRAMSYANYRTGDGVEDYQTDLCACGWPDPHASMILGRMDDYVYAGDGTRVGRIDHIFKGESGIHGSQVIQEKDGGLMVNLLMPVKDPATMDRIAQRLMDRVPGRAVEVKIADSLLLNSSGKALNVICKMDA